MKRAYCAAMTDAIIRQTKAMPKATEQVIWLDRQKTIANVSMDIASC